MYDLPTTNTVFQLILSNIAISDNTHFLNSNGILDTYVSSVTLSDSKFYDLSFKDAALKMASSTIKITNCEAFNISSTDGSPLMGISFESVLSINGFKFYNSSTPFIELLASTPTLEGLHITNIIADRTVINIGEDTNFSIKNSVISQIRSNNANPFVIYRSGIGKNCCFHI